MKQIKLFLITFLFIVIFGSVGTSGMSNPIAYAQLGEDEKAQELGDLGQSVCSPDEQDMNVWSPELSEEATPGEEQLCTGEEQVCTEDQPAPAGGLGEQPIGSENNVCTGEQPSGPVCTGEQQYVSVMFSVNSINKILDKLRELAKISTLNIKGLDIVYGSRNFGDAVYSLISALESSLNEPGASTKVSTSSVEIHLPALAIALKALEYWVNDDGKTWGTSDDTSDFTSSAGCYAAVEGEENKCNIFVAEVIYGATGVTFKDIKEEKGGGGMTPYHTGKYIPYRARDWGNPKTTIPNFKVTDDPKLGDIWGIIYPKPFYQADSGHVGIYLGQHNGVKIYVSARSDPDGAYGIGKIQHEDGIQVKELIPPKKGEPSGGTYKQYSPIK